MAKYNDIDLSNGKYDPSILTSSLWIMQRENSGVHNADYHGNFIPQVPRQLFSRYTKKGDWILDPFSGSGTALIEAQRMKRNAIGIELQEEVAKESQSRIKQERNNESKIRVVCGNSQIINMNKLLEGSNIKNVQFIIFHPPYWDMIKFSEDKNDLSNSDTLEDYLNRFGKVIDNTTNYLEKDRYCAVVVGDKFANSQVIPLGFYCMNLFIERGFLLKAILVKNFDRTKGKAGQEKVWRYRALSSDIYVFDHEYIFIFKKP